MKHHFYENNYYFKLLPDKSVVPCKMEDIFNRDFTADMNYRRVDQTDIGKIFVSTVFLERNHRFGDDGPPLLFETMIFGSDDPELKDYQERCSTYAEALEMHERAVQFVKKYG